MFYYSFSIDGIIYRIKIKCNGNLYLNNNNPRLKCDRNQSIIIHNVVYRRHNWQLYIYIWVITDYRAIRGGYEVGMRDRNFMIIVYITTAVNIFAYNFCSNDKHNISKPIFFSDPRGYLFKIPTPLLINSLKCITRRITQCIYNSKYGFIT